MAFISYAQNYEDVILWRALREVEQGFYVDVGAADPEVASVTRAFYEHGWSGINVEPLEKHFEQLVRHRPRDTNLNVAAGREAGVRAFYALPLGLSTLDPQIHAKHQAEGLQGNEIIVPVLSLAKILEDFTDRTIHFLKIDVEGMEAEVLEGLDLQRVRPWVILVEATEPNSPVRTTRKWEHLITGRGYRFAYFDGLNCFYVADERSSLADRLATPPNVFDDFVRWSELFHTEKAAALSAELVNLQRHAGGLEAALHDAKAHGEGLEKLLEATRAEVEQVKNGLKAEHTHAAELRDALMAEQVHAAGLQAALKAEQARAAELRDALQVEKAYHAELRKDLQLQQAKLDLLVAGAKQLEEALTARRASVFRQAVQNLRETGDRLTGGGARALGRRVLAGSLRRPPVAGLTRRLLRPFPNAAGYLDKLASPSQPSTARMGSVISNAAPAPFPASIPAGPGEAPSPSEAEVLAGTLPASARTIFFRLQAAITGHNQSTQTR